MRCAVEKQQVGFLRGLLGIRLASPNAVVLAETGETPLWQCWLRRNAKFSNVAGAPPPTAWCAKPSPPPVPPILQALCPLCGVRCSSAPGALRAAQVVPRPCLPQRPRLPAATWGLRRRSRRRSTTGDEENWVPHPGVGAGKPATNPSSCHAVGLLGRQDLQQRDTRLAAAAMNDRVQQKVKRKERQQEQAQAQLASINAAGKALGL